MLARRCIIFPRVCVHFGEAEVPDDPEELILNRDALERMLDGTYWK